MPYEYYGFRSIGKLRLNMLWTWIHFGKRRKKITALSSKNLAIIFLLMFD